MKAPAKAWIGEKIKMAKLKWIFALDSTAFGCTLTYFQQSQHRVGKRGDGENVGLGFKSNILINKKGEVNLNNPRFYFKSYQFGIFRFGKPTFLEGN